MDRCLDPTARERLSVDELVEELDAIMAQLPIVETTKYGGNHSVQNQVPHSVVQDSDDGDANMKSNPEHV